MIDKYNKAKRNCIVISLDEFEQILDELAYSNDLNLDRLTYSCMKEDYDNEINLYPLFEKYFDIKKITSIHADDDDYPDIWIVYKDK